MVSIFLMGFAMGYGLCYALNKYKDQDTKEFSELKKKLKTIERKRNMTKQKWWKI